MELRSLLRPRCCGSPMKLTAEGMRFAEAVCKKCGDVVYLKKNEEHAPQLIDD